MRWSWRNIMIGTSAAVAAIGLAVALVVVLAGQGVPPATPKPGPGRSSQLYSPFTGEPVTALGRVLAVKIDNLAPARPQTGLADAGHRLRPAGGGRAEPVPGRVLVAFPAGHRPGAQRPRG